MTRYALAREGLAFRTALAFLAIVIALGAGASAAHAYSFGEPYVRATGPEQTAFDWTTDRCEDIDIPDAPARAFTDSNGNVSLLASHFVSRRNVGLSLDTVQHSCNLVFNSHYDADPRAYADREWLSSTYTPDGKTVYALVHDEYQGWRYDSACGTVWAQQQTCWMNAITSAVSTDGGATFAAAPSPSHVVASAPYPYARGTGPFGYFKPTNIVRRPEDGYFYFLVRAEANRAQSQGTCVLRTTNLADAASWRAWDGNDFTVRFINPYVETRELPSAHVCRPVDTPVIGTMSASLTYSSYLGKFVLLDGIAPVDDQGLEHPGIYYATSSDLVHWGDRRLLMNAEVTWTHACGDPDPVGNPSLIDADSPSRNFDVMGRRAYLYFTRFNIQYSSGTCFMSLDRDLIRIPVEFEEAATQPPPQPAGTQSPPAVPQLGSESIAAARPRHPAACASARQRRDRIARKLRGARLKLKRAKTLDAKLRYRKQVRSLQQRLRRARSSAKQHCKSAEPASKP